jgi:MOSC domain-containing protein YiiM
MARRNNVTRNIANHYNRRMLGRVRSLSVKFERGARSVFRDQVQVAAGGFEGDYHTGHSRRRQILLLSGTLLDQFNLNAGDLYENVVIDGIDVMSLREGQELRLGTALVAVTIPCEPCSQMDRLRPGLQEELRDCRGMFVRVLEPGTVRLGDTLREEMPRQTSLQL